MRVSAVWRFAAPGLLVLSACHAPVRAPGPHPAVPMAAVAFPAAAPFSSICKLEVHRREVRGLVEIFHEAVSTATLVDAHHLLTTAHSFASPPHLRVMARAMECGGHGNHAAWAHADRFRREHLHRVADWPENLADDYAVMRVGGAAPFGPGFRLPRPGETVLRPGDTVHVAGFALDGRGFDGRTLYHGSGRVRATSRDSSAFVYDVDTRGGMSGSPVWVVRAGPRGDPEYVIVGVHVGRHRIGRQLWAVARRIRGEALANVQGWLAADTVAR